MEAPDFSLPGYPEVGYPNKGARLGPAWREIWAALAADPEAWKDGQALTNPIAEKHGLSAVTLRVLMSRAAQCGVVDRRKLPVATEVSRLRKDGKVTTFTGQRARTHYRINPDRREP